MSAFKRRSKPQLSMRLLSAVRPTKQKQKDHKFVIGDPYSTERPVHMEVDGNSKLGLSGFPQEWADELEALQIPVETLKQNIGKVKAVMQFKQDGRRNNLMPLPTRDALQKQMDELAQIRTMNPDSKYEKLEFIASGSSGIVHKVRVKATKQIQAVKISQDSEYEFIKQEIAFHAMSHHPNIVSYHETFLWNKEMWIVMDFIDGGSLTEICGYPDLENGNLDDTWHIEEWAEGFIAFVMREVLKALDYLHSKHLIHRDIKSDNVLIGRDGTIKLADFGFAIGLTQQDTKRKSNVGSPFWMAPEVISGEYYDESCDIWSLGITAIELILHEPPHFDKEQVSALLNIVLLPPPTPMNLYKNGRDNPELFNGLNYSDTPGPNPDRFSEPFLDFLDMMLQKKGEDRASSAELLAHKFVTKASTRESFAEWVVHVLRERARLFV